MVSPSQENMIIMHTPKTQPVSLEKSYSAPKREDEYPEGGWRAWSVAIGNSWVMFSTLGYVNSWGVYQAYYETHQLHNASPSSIAWIESLQAFFIFSGGLIVGPLFDRYGGKISHSFL